MILKKIENKLLNYFAKRKVQIMFKVYINAGLMVFIALILITNSIASILDVLILVSGVSFLSYFTLFGYKYLL